jgi:CAAX prenyl protease-like protein
MFFTWVGSHEGWYPISYYLKTAIVAAMLWYFWPRFTRISWKYWWLGVIAGVIGVVQWVGMEKGLLHVWPNYPRLPGVPMDPFKEFARPAAAWTFIAYRWMGATLLVPVMEELFWRDFLYRQFIAPNDFKMAEVGEYDGTAFLLVAVIFGAGVHIQWATAIVYGLGIGGLLVYTRSLGACIICHAVTNFLLGGYVLWRQDWYFW